MSENNMFIRQGWECPKCGRVYSPDTFMCYYCSDSQTNVSTNRIDYQDYIERLKEKEARAAE